MDTFLDVVEKHFFFELLVSRNFPLLFCLPIFLLLTEAYWQLQVRKEPIFKRIKTGAGVAAVALLSLRIVLIPAMLLLAKWAEETQIGLLHWLALPTLGSFAVGFLLLDYGNYLWHTLNHKIKVAGFFHKVHHMDLELDVITDVRFHFGEVIFPVFFRGLVVVLQGPPAVLVLVYEIFFEAATSFHHANRQRSYSLGKKLSWLIGTPRMQDIPPAIGNKETDSNYSAFFSCWDRMHRTMLLNNSQKKFNIGVPSCRNIEEQRWKNLLVLSFVNQRGWQLPNGGVAERKPSTNTKNYLLP